MPLPGIVRDDMQKRVLVWRTLTLPVSLARKANTDHCNSADIFVWIAISCPRQAINALNGKHRHRFHLNGAIAASHDRKCGANPMASHEAARAGVGQLAI
jgi:hypothetical protein